MKFSNQKLMDLFGGDQSLVDRYIILAKQELPKELDQLQNLLVQGNNKEAAVVAHSIKGQCNYLDLKKCSLLAQEIENLTEENTFMKSDMILFVTLALNINEVFLID